MSNGSLSISHLGIGNLKNISLTIAPGEIHCISGKSGSGKSRFLRAVADLDEHQGSISLGKVAQSKISGHQWRCMVRMVPAESEWWYDTVVDHFPESPSVSTLQSFQLDTGILSQSVGFLSSGEKQRLALLRSMHPTPQALLLDEPTANLDDSSRASVENWLLQIIRQQQWPTIWVAHDAEQIHRVSDHHWRLENGQLTEVGKQP